MRATHKRNLDRETRHFAAYSFAVMTITAGVAACVSTDSESPPQAHNSISHQMIKENSKVSQPKHASSRQLELEEDFDKKRDKFEREITEIIQSLTKTSRFLVSDFSSDRIDLRGGTLTESSKIDRLLAQQMRDVVEQGLTQHGYTVVDRSRLNELRSELDFNYSGMVDDAQMIRVGKTVGATHLITGGISSVRGETPSRHVRIYSRWNIKIIELERMILVGGTSMDFWMTEGSKQ